MDKKLYNRYLKLDRIYPIYYITGNNQWLKTQCLNIIIEKINMDKQNTELYKFEGQNINISDFINLCESIPLGCDFKCIVVKDWDLSKLTVNEAKILSDVFSNIADFCNIIIANINIEIANIKIKKFIEIIKKNGLIVNCPLQTLADIIEFIVEKVKQDNSSISKFNARKLSEYCNNDLNKISYEIDKLTSFCYDREINQNDIELLVTPSMEFKVFDMIKFINNRNIKQTLNFLNQLLNNKEDPVMILSIIAMNFIDIYRIKIAQQNNKKTMDIVDLFDYKGKDFRVNKAFLQSNKYNLFQLKNIINLLIETDYCLKTSSMNKKIIMEKTIIKIFNFIGENKYQC